MSQRLCPLPAVPESEVRMYGGKAVNLSKLIKFGFNVPNGFVIPVSVFEQWLLNGKQGIDASTQSQILTAFDALKVETVVVRSSAGVEDGKGASWAGQFESFLCVKRSGLIAAIEECFDSCFSKRATTYAVNNPSHTNALGMAVIVQAMVMSDVAGVAFSRHPVTQSESVVYIEAVSGVGERLVSGEITPDHWVVEKVSAVLLEHKTELQILSSMQVRTLTQLIKEIELKFGFAVDVEWCLKDNEFFIVQTRPITTLKNTISDIAH